MVPRSHKLLWCVALASSLLLVGCNHMPSNSADQPPPKDAPELAPPLLIPNPPAAPAPVPKQIAANTPNALPIGGDIGSAVAANEAKSVTASPPETSAKWWKSAAAPNALPASVPETTATVTPPSMRAVLVDPKAGIKSGTAPALAPAQTVLRPLVDSPMRALYRMAAESIADKPGYIALFKRRELVEGKERAEEVIIFKYRRDPASIYMRWTGAEAKNRELVYVKGQHDDMLHVAPGSGDTLFGGSAGHQVVLRPDTARGLGKERYAVAETGIAALIARYGRLVEAYEGGAKVGTLKYLETIQRPESDVALEAVMHIVPPGVDGTLPQGGQRLWFFDPKNHFPVLVIAHDSQGREAEYYFFDRLLFPDRIHDDQFSPSAIGHR
jgi:hypothetical protein